MHLRRAIELIFLILFLPFMLYSQGREDSTPIVVNLATESPLAPLYLVSLQNDQGAFAADYVKQLEEVFAFDLNYNGATSLIKPVDELNHLVLSKAFESAKSIEQWQAASIDYVIKGAMHGHQLSILLLDVNKQIIKKLDSPSLTGELAKDRRQIHLLSDAIHKALFGTNGIASTHILYSFKVHLPNGDSIAEIWESDYDGANIHPVTQEKNQCISPVYIPPKPGNVSGGFLYVSYQIGQPKIYVARLKEGVGQRLTYLKGNQLMPAISAQRDKVAFISDVTGNPDLFLQPFSPEAGAIGKPQQIFAAKQATQGSPTFSLDGKQIAFVSNKDGSPRIYILEIPKPGARLEDLKVTLISKKNRENSAPCWSPDGTKIAYCAASQGERQIWIYDVSTKQEKQLTEGPGHKENPSWAPNSLHLVFNSGGAQGNELYLINLNQRKAIQITGGKGEKRFPNWESRVIL